MFLWGVFAIYLHRIARMLEMPNNDANLNAKTPTHDTRLNLKHKEPFPS